MDLLLLKQGTKILYTYDFGDGWDHLIETELVTESVPGQPYPVCIDGKMACPPEDCGGVPGYEELVRTLAAPDINK